MLERGAPVASINSRIVIGRRAICNCFRMPITRSTPLALVDSGADIHSTPSAIGFALYLLRDASLACGGRCAVRPLNGRARDAETAACVRSADSRRSAQAHLAPRSRLYP